MPKQATGIISTSFSFRHDFRHQLTKDGGQLPLTEASISSRLLPAGSKKTKQQLGSISGSTVTCGWVDTKVVGSQKVGVRINLAIRSCALNEGTFAGSRVPQQLSNTLDTENWTSLISAGHGYPHCYWH
jgi:hypothetical protein